MSRNLRMYVMTEPKESSGWKGRRENDLLAITYCVPPSCRPAGITSHHKTFFGQPLFCREKLNCRGKISEGKLSKCWKVGTSWFSLIFLLSPSRAGDLIGEEDALFLQRGALFSEERATSVFALKHESRKIRYCRDVEKSSRSLIFQPVLSSRGRQEPKLAGT